ncbi:hypothetical protein C8A05DRAFT_42452 [Staphylotrichum tortipilum]|uniref:Uncharacterized protein n=1 Tax=Staphylotrichum tortipilum TaxID=2831512 RepID=A0AAN6MR49_9PEZI|nr:hypothetical protein C8A05DRAFT_42452 [Staphylotrichum longicolle]
MVQPSVLRQAATCLTALATLSSASSLPPSIPTGFGPSKAAAKENAFQIFNAIHSAMRQWGSSRHHNGMSLFLATIPPGVILHHGTHSPIPPPGPEWLAFDIEHAELFAHPARGGGGPGGGKKPPTLPPPSPPNPKQQHPLPVSSNPPVVHGYLHLYRTTAPLRLLYLDGTSAGNTPMGTLDTQDLLLRGNRSTPVWDERGRAADLCRLVAAEWGLHGVLRMEAGFEVIKCGAFAGDGMELVAANQRPGFVRAIARRYHGIGGGRVVVDWGSMVSGLFYGVDLGNPDESRGDLPRLVRVKDGELRGIRERVGEVVRERVEGGNRVVDWQGVVDLVVARYADRLRYMVEGVEELEVMQGEVNGLSNTHIDYAVEDDGFQAAIGRCARHYTMSVVPVTQEDHLILAAIETVTGSICTTIFVVRKVLVEDPDADEASLDRAKGVLRGLMDKLNWTRWKECPACRKRKNKKPKECVSRESNAGPIDGNDGFYH